MQQLQEEEMFNVKISEILLGMTGYILLATCFLYGYRVKDHNHASDMV